MRSTDKGVTWSGADLRSICCGTIGVTDPETGDAVRTGDIIPDIAVDPANGNLYAVWQDVRFSGGQGYASIAFSMSHRRRPTW